MNLEVPTFHGPPCSRRGKVCSTLKLRFADGGIEMFHHVTITWVFTNIQNSIRKNTALYSGDRNKLTIACSSGC